MKQNSFKSSRRKNMTSTPFPVFRKHRRRQKTSSHKPLKIRGINKQKRRPPSLEKGNWNPYRKRKRKRRHMQWAFKFVQAMGAGNMEASQLEMNLVKPKNLTLAPSARVHFLFILIFHLHFPFFYCFDTCLLSKFKVKKNERLHEK